MNKFADLYRRYHPAMEMIAIQTDDYATKVEKLFGVLLDDFRTGKVKQTGLSKHDSVLKVETLTFERTGIRVRLNLRSHLGAVIPFYVNEYNILLDEMFRGSLYEFKDRFISQQKKIMNQALIKKGTVDNQTVKVTGVFSEYETPIYLNIPTISQMGMGSDELTAIFLHELGHAFSAFEYSNRLNTTNQVLAEIARERLDKNNLSRDYVYKRLKSVNRKTTQEQVDAMLSDDKNVMTKATFEYTKELITSQMQDTRYDENSFETLADSFAARWGYGVALVTALKRLGDKFGDPSQSLGMTIMVSITSILTIVASVCLIVMAFLLAGPVAPLVATYSIIIGVISLVVTILSNSSHAQTMTYDDIKYRYQRVRNQCVEAIKDNDLPKKQVKDLIEQINTLDLIIEKTKGYKNLVHILVDFFTPGNRASVKDTEFQRLLESLSANDLYIASAMLRTA